MSNPELINLIKELAIKENQILLAKNRDYSGDSGLDVFKNFNLSSQLSGVSVERSILVRICDKLSRLSTLIDSNNPYVTDEKIEDTISDARNYLGILFAYRMGQLVAETTINNSTTKS